MCTSWIYNFVKNIIMFGRSFVYQIKKNQNKSSKLKARNKIYLKYNNNILDNINSINYEIFFHFV